MSLRRLCGALALSAALAGCGDLSGTPFEGLDQTVDALVDRAGRLGDPAAAPQAAAPLTRAAISADPAATIRVTDRAGREAILRASVLLDGQATYRTLDNVSLAFMEQSLVRSRGLSDDISGADPAPAEALRAALALRPGQQTGSATHARSFYRIGPLADVEETRFDCTFVRGAAERIEIVELTFDTVRVEEACADVDILGPTPRAFVNTWWVDPASGLAWKSRQWVSDEQGYLTIEVLKPLG